jgi:Cu/Ag efflux pump CusA
VARSFAGVMKFPLLNLAAAIGLLAVGIVRMRDARLDVLPELSTPYAEIKTETLGLSAVEGEQPITVPREADFAEWGRKRRRLSIRIALSPVLRRLTKGLQQ